MALNLYSILLVSSFALFLAIHPSAAHSRKLKSTRESSFASLDEVRHFLQAYGYMESSEDPNGANSDTLTVESSLKPALRLYQDRNGLKVTGKLDSETKARMMVPRCGVPDIVRKPAKGTDKESRLGKVQVVADYAFFNRMDPWTQRQLTYTFTSTIPSVSLEVLREICARAFQRWAAVSPFKFQEAADGAQANIKIGFYVGYHGDTSPFDGPHGVLAHSAPPQDGRLHFDGSEDWSTSTPTMSEVDLESVAMHEIGHTLGLVHSPDPTAVMYASIADGVVKRELQQDDIDGIQALYPSK